MEIVCRHHAGRSVEAWRFAQQELQPLSVTMKRQDDASGCTILVEDPIPPLGIAFVRLESHLAHPRV